MDSIPPLLGDGKGRYRVHITGNSDHNRRCLGCLAWCPAYFTGRVILAAWLEEINRQVKIRQNLDQDDRGWVVDGDYETSSNGMVVTESTDIIWLDPPLLLYFPRVFYRTILRLLGLRAPCSPGCLEDIRETFSKQGILWWCLSNHWHCRRLRRARMAEIGLGIGTIAEGRKMRRFGGWGGELTRWLKQVESMCRARDKTP